MRTARTVLLLLALAACGDQPVKATAPTPATTTTVAGSAHPVVATIPTPTTTPGPASQCGPYSDDRSTRVFPGTTTVRAPAEPALRDRALRPGDVPCTRDTELETVDWYGVRQFRPCGFAFADTSAALGRYEIVVQAASGYLGGTNMGPPIGYVQEVVARYTPAGAARVFTDFRNAVAACPFTDGPPGWTGRRFTEGDDGSGGAEYVLSEVTVPAEADDVYAVEFFCCEPGRFLLVAMRRGPYVAFLRTFYIHGGQRAATPYLEAAASRLAGG